MIDIRLPLPAALRHRLETDDRFWAHAVSLVFSPPLVWSAWIYAITLPGADDKLSAFVFASLFVISICVLPMSFVAIQVRGGKISDMHMRLSRERYIPYSIAIAAALASLALMFHFEAQPVLQIVTLVSIVELSIILAGTFFAHISLHAMGMSSIIAANALIFGFERSLVFVPLLMLVILARLALKRHTAIQILIGALIGVLTPLLVVAILGQLL